MPPPLVCIAATIAMYIMYDVFACVALTKECDTLDRSH